MANAREGVQPVPTDETVNKNLKTWQEKMEAGEPLNSLEETKADADFNVKHRVREAEERAAHEARKAGMRTPSQVNANKENK